MLDKMPLITIGNDGEKISETNFWDLGIDKIYLSWNAGAARLLVPEIYGSHIAEMKTGKKIFLCKHTIQNKPAFAVLFDDNSNSPYVIESSIDASDRTIDFSDKKKRNLYVYSKTGLEIENRFSIRKRLF